MTDENSLIYLDKKEVLVLFGTTGSGKSTLANALIQGVDKILQKHDGNYYVEKNIEFAGEKIFQIGH